MTETGRGAAIGRRDEEPAAPTSNDQSGTAANRPPPATNQGGRQPHQAQGNGRRAGNGDATTNKQLQFILTMGKRCKLSTPQLEHRISQIIGRKWGVYELTKKKPGLVLHQFTNGGNGNGRQSQ